MCAPSIANRLANACGPDAAPRGLESERTEVAALLMVGRTVGGKSKMTNQYSQGIQPFAPCCETFSRRAKMNHPLLLLMLTCAGLYIAKLWRDDLRTIEREGPNVNALPGARQASHRAVMIGIVGAIVLLLTETAGEIALGIADEQSKMTWLFALYSVCAAPVIEELIFRGWLVVENRGPVTMWAAAFGASIAFAALHPFLWRWEDAGFEFTFGRKGWFSTSIVFASSLWFYAARLGPWNKSRSLLPCFAGHAAKNLGVVVIKATTGFMSGLW
jgi:uncharacterized protein